MGMTIPGQYDGQGSSYHDAVLVIEEIARVCGVTGRIAVEANMGAIGAIMQYGSAAQKQLAINPLSASPSQPPVAPPPK